MLKAIDVLLYSQVTGLTVEFELDGRTFQISGRQGMSGFWERFFPENDHPYRQKMTEAKMNVLLASAHSFQVYKIWKDRSEELDAQAFAKKIKDTLKGTQGGDDGKSGGV